MTASFLHLWLFFFSLLLPEGFGGDRAGAAHSQQVIQPGGDHAGEHWPQIVRFFWGFFFHHFVYSVLVVSRCSLRNKTQAKLVRGHELLWIAGSERSYCSRVTAGSPGQ